MEEGGGQRAVPVGGGAGEEIRIPAGAGERRRSIAVRRETYSAALVRGAPALPGVPRLGASKRDLTRVAPTQNICSSLVIFIFFFSAFVFLDSAFKAN